jgi:serine/threonine protein kinase
LSHIQILEKYSLVLEYADGGTLQNYLQKSIKELKWDDRINLALQVADAISCLHRNDIIHCDLVIINYLLY